MNSSTRFESFLRASGLKGNLGRREELLGRPQLRAPPGEESRWKLGARYCCGSVSQPPGAWRPLLPRSPGMRCSSPTCSDSRPPGDALPHLRCSSHLQCFLAPAVLPPRNAPPAAFPIRDAPAPAMRPISRAPHQVTLPSPRRPARNPGPARPPLAANWRALSRRGERFRAAEAQAGFTGCLAPSPERSPACSPWTKTVSPRPPGAPSESSSNNSPGPAKPSAC